MHTRTAGHPARGLRRGRSAGLPVTLLLAALPALYPAADVSAAQEARAPRATLRDTLSAVAPVPAVKQGVERMRQQDPHASFTWVRGHVDAFSTHPKATVPGYAARVLKRASSRLAGLPEATDLSPMPFIDYDLEPDLALPYPAEADARLDLGFHGEDDLSPLDAPWDDAELTSRDSNPDGTTWYTQDGDEEVALEVLRAFLLEHNDIFRLDPALLDNGLPNLVPVRYGVGRHFRRAELTQRIDGLPVLNGKTVVLFDLNWNVVAISRQLVTKEKVGLRATKGLELPRARKLALSALANRRGVSQARLEAVSSSLGVDVVRGTLAWEIEIEDRTNRAEYAVTLHGGTGKVLNIADNTARYSDATVRRWGYTDGDMTEAVQYVDTGIYTHDDNTLVHDFFYLVNDDRTDGSTGTCNDTSPASTTTPAAYGTTTSATYVRPTLRSDRDFSLWAPSAPKGSFGESHAYYWARNYMQWQKQAMVDLGVLTTGDFNNYTKALIIVNACEDGAGVFKSSFPVSTYESKGENLGTILLPERCRSGNGNCSSTDYQDSNSGNLYSFEDDGGYHFPGVIHHELNHFVLIDYFNVKNKLDCGADIELQFFQEGGLGRTLAQMYWHSYYGVGYAPASTDQLFRSDGVSGRTHTDDTDINHLSSFACEDGEDDPYGFGGVVAQPMWEIYHGQKVAGSTITAMARPAEDLGMIKSMYYAADLTSASTFQDRFELANRFMEFWELFSTAVSTTKEDWCEVWDDHGVGTWINSSYCS